MRVISDTLLILRINIGMTTLKASFQSIFIFSEHAMDLMKQTPAIGHVDASDCRQQKS